MRIRAELESTGRTTTGFPVPEEVVEALGGGGMGGRYLLGVSADRRTAAGISGGDVLDVDVELDTAPRTVDVPDDLATAMAAESAAKEFWDTLSYSNQQWHAQQIAGIIRELQQGPQAAASSRAA